MAEENSILTDTKKVLGIAEEYTAFDLDVIIHINSSFAILNQLGLGTADVLVIEDKEPTWDELELPANQLSMVKSYVYMKTRMSFDPPNTGFLLDAMKNVIQEQETRLSYLRETTLPVPE